MYTCAHKGVKSFWRFRFWLLVDASALRKTLCAPRVIVPSIKIVYRSRTVCAGLWVVWPRDRPVRSRRCPLGVCVYTPKRAWVETSKRIRFEIPRDRLARAQFDKYQWKKKNVELTAPRVSLHARFTLKIFIAKLVRPILGGYDESNVFGFLL